MSASYYFTLGGKKTKHQQNYVTRRRKGLNVIADPANNFECILLYLDPEFMEI